MVNGYSIRLLIVAALCVLSTHAYLPYSLCDDLPTNDTRCNYVTNSTTADSCMVYSYPGSAYCTRCMNNLYLTPTISGQYCSQITSDYLAKPPPPPPPQSWPDGTACSLSMYNQIKSSIILKGLILKTVQDPQDGTNYQVCWAPAYIQTYPQYCSSYNVKINPINGNLQSASIGCQ